MKSIRSISLALIVVAIVFSCSPKLSPTTSVKTENKNEKIVAPSEELIAKGKMVYDTKCGTCHELMAVGSFSKSSWKHILPNMNAQAKLSVTEVEQINAYVYSIAK